MSYVIVTDTSANLPDEIVRRYKLAVVPLSYYINGEEHKCVELDPFDDVSFYARLTDPQVKATTSLINSSAYVECFEPVLKRGEDVLYIAMSSGISGSYAASVEAARQLAPRYPERKIICFDTLAASLGEGLQVVEAAKLRDKGASIEEALEYLNSSRLRMRQVFTVDDLMHLKRGGRVGTVTAVIGTVLQIKPILIGDAEGKIIVADKARGRKASIAALANDLAEKIDSPYEQTIGIAHAGCPQDAKTLAELIKAKFHKAQILIVKYEPVTGLHVGTGALALFFFKKI